MRGEKHEKLWTNTWPVRWRETDRYVKRGSMLLWIRLAWSFPAQYLHMAQHSVTGHGSSSRQGCSQLYMSQDRTSRRRLLIEKESTSKPWKCGKDEEQSLFLLPQELLPSVCLYMGTSLAYMPWPPKLHTPQLWQGEDRAFQEFPKSSNKATNFSSESFWPFSELLP